METNHPQLQELRRHRLAVELIGVHHHFLLKIHRHVVGWGQGKLLLHHVLAREPHAGMVAAELGDGFVHTLIEQILVTLKAVQNIPLLAELERLAVRTVMLEHAICADVVQQPAVGGMGVADTAASTVFSVRRLLPRSGASFDSVQRRVNSAFCRRTIWHPMVATITQCV